VPDIRSSHPVLFAMDMAHSQFALRVAHGTLYLPKSSSVEYIRWQGKQAKYTGNGGK
jgi:hypothetical protein